MHATSVVVRIVAASSLALAAFGASAQARPPTTEQLGKDPGALRQEAERQQSQDRAAQQQRSQDAADQQWNDTVRQNQSRANADAHIAATRRGLEQRPPLPPEKNPLLGRWESLGVTQRAGAAGLPPELAKMAAELVGGMTAGMCDNMVSRGTIEFRPGGVFALRDGRERMLYRAEYRSNGAQVIVLPMGGTTFNWMYIDFHGRDRAMVSQVGCNLTRSGPGTATAAMATTAVAATSEGGAPLQWKLLGHVDNAGGIDVYIAPSTVRRSGDKARMIDLFDFKKRQSFDGKPFLSARNEYEYDCTNPRQRMVGTTGFSGQMATGTVVASNVGNSPWQPVGSSGPAFDHWQIACKR